MLDVYFSTPMWIKSRGVTYNGGRYHLNIIPFLIKRQKGSKYHGEVNK